MRHTHISARQNSFSLNSLKELWQYRELVLLFTRRSFQVRYKQTILGPLWLFINPLLTSVIQVILFGNIAKLSTDGVPQLLFYLSGNAIWAFFSDRVRRNSETFTGNAHLFGKVYFPRLVIPVSDMFVGVIQFLIQMMLVAAFYIFYCVRGMVSPGWAYMFLLPLVLVHLGLMGLGTGIIISSLTTKYRDLLVLVSFGLQLWMYATPIVYPLSTLSGALKTILLLNPVTMPVELFRLALFGTGTVCLWSLVWSFFCMAAVLITGISVFSRVERTFIDTI